MKIYCSCAILFAVIFQNSYVFCKELTKKIKATLTKMRTTIVSARPTPRAHGTARHGALRWLAGSIVGSSVHRIRRALEPRWSREQCGRGAGRPGHAQLRVAVAGTGTTHPPRARSDKRKRLAHSAVAPIRHGTRPPRSRMEERKWMVSACVAASLARSCPRGTCRPPLCRGQTMAGLPRARAPTAPTVRATP
jgi:hypothetical protein